MRYQHSGTILLALLLGSACGPKTAANSPAPLVEFICAGRSSVGDVRERVDATNRDEAVAKFKKKHADIPVATCTPNPR